jgi:hypothetical protein
MNQRQRQSTLSLTALDHSHLDEIHKDVAAVRQLFETDDFEHLSADLGEYYDNAAGNLPKNVRDDNNIEENFKVGKESFEKSMTKSVISKSKLADISKSIIAWHEKLKEIAYQKKFWGDRNLDEELIDGRMRFEKAVAKSAISRAKLGDAAKQLKEHKVGLNEIMFDDEPLPWR